MKKMYCHTFGCKVNQYETEVIRGALSGTGFAFTDDYSGADVCIINSCSVTAEADRKCRQFVRKILRSNNRARVIVTGCLATRDPQSLMKISAKIEVFPNSGKDMIPASISGCAFPEGEKFSLAAFSGHTRAFLKVQDGCDSKCTYCVIPQVRPEMISRNPDEIVPEIRYLLGKGYKEIVLAGIRLGSYGLSSGRGRAGKNNGSLTELLRKIMLVPGEFRVRLSSLEITEVTEELLGLISSSRKLCRHFHLPLQSGDDTVLKRMGRWYDPEYFAGKVSSIREIIPDAGIFSDIMVGFPGESEENFLNSFKFAHKHFNGLHVFPFSSRPGTPASRLPGHIDPKTTRNRVERLLALDKKLRKDFRARFTGTERMVLAETEGGFTDNGIRVPPPLPIPEGELGMMAIP